MVSSLIFALAAVTPALASDRHDGRNPPPPVRGTVIGLTATSLQLQTPSGGVAVPLNSSTRVIRVVSGSMKDVRVNSRVDVHLIQSGTVVDSIRLQPSSGPTTHHPFFRREGEPEAPAKANIGASFFDHHGPSGFRDEVWGTVVSVGNGSLQLRIYHGKTVTYRLASSVAVTKLCIGSQNDLALGETVRVFRGRNGGAQEVDILSA